MYRVFGADAQRIFHDLHIVTEHLGRHLSPGTVLGYQNESASSF